MATSDHFVEQVVRGSTGLAKIAQSLNHKNSLIVARDENIPVFDKEIDEKWAYGYRKTDAPHSYFDYYFAGQDILVGIDGVEDEYGNIPISQMGFNIEQQKTPLYGLWSYTMDAVMRGTRLVTGSFTITTKSPDYMKNLLSKAARSRQEQEIGFYSARPLTEDDLNISKYWTNKMDPNVSAAGLNIFSSHPPFSFVIIYGVQNTSITADWSDGGSYEAMYNDDNALSLDYNERLVESDPVNQSGRLVIEDCELQACQIGFAPDGTPCTETYQFFARDVIIPPPRAIGSHLDTAARNPHVE